MESVALHRRGNLAPSASALATESARPLADRLIKSPKPLMKKQAVKRHHHKHNLRHRYEFLETLGKGTYGKVKKARESSGRLMRYLSVFLGVHTFFLGFSHLIFILGHSCQ